MDDIDEEHTLEIQDQFSLLYFLNYSQMKINQLQT
jgi:hypothetical protein